MGLEELVRAADFLTIHLPRTPETTGLIGKELLSQARPGLRIVNTAREAASTRSELAWAIEEGFIAGAVKIQALRGLGQRGSSARSARENEISAPSVCCLEEHGRRDRRRQHQQRPDERVDDDLDRRRPPVRPAQPRTRNRNGTSIRSKNRTNRARSWAMNAPSTAVSASPRWKANGAGARPAQHDHSAETVKSSAVSAISHRFRPSTPSL